MRREGCSTSFTSSRGWGGGSVVVEASLLSRLSCGVDESCGESSSCFKREKVISLQLWNAHSPSDGVSELSRQTNSLPVINSGRGCVINQLSPVFSCGQGYLSVPWDAAAIKYNRKGDYEFDRAVNRKAPTTLRICNKPMSSSHCS